MAGKDRIRFLVLWSPAAVSRPESVAKSLMITVITVYWQAEFGFDRGKERRKKA